MADTFIIMVLALVVFGPRKLPQIGRQIGKLMYEFRKASNDFKFQMEEELRSAEEADRRKREEAERQQRLALTAESASTQESASADSSATAAAIEAAAPAPASDTATEAPYPRILPPSTGEPVAATRPGSVAAEESAESAAEHAGTADADPAGKEAAAEQPGAVTEQAAHNG
jgi:sec-independent protein translocase protein TatB